MSDLVGKSEDRTSRDMACIIPLNLFVSQAGLEIMCAFLNC